MDMKNALKRKDLPDTLFPFSPCAKFSLNISLDKNHKFCLLLLHRKASSYHNPFPPHYGCKLFMAYN